MKKTISQKATADLLQLLKVRFDQNQHRHSGIVWEAVEKKLIREPVKLWSLQQMELTGGQPDVALQDPASGDYLFFDFAKETPKERTSLCYDQDALTARKEHKPRGSALGLAAAMNIEILNEEQYRYLQALEPVDLKTSSWIHTPSTIRKLGGALFCDRRYDHVFVYHNGATSYYAVRGFRGSLSV